MLVKDWGKVKGSPQRLSKFLGMFSKEGKVTIPSEIKGNRSSFSMVKYKFLLESPFKISDKCCNIMKKKPAHDYEKQTGRKAITGQTASESKMRTQKWLQHGCNAFDSTSPKSNPMSFWTEQDVLLYIYENHLPIASVYGEVTRGGEEYDGQMRWSDVGLLDEIPLLKCTGVSRTGCMFCGFGCHLEKEGQGRFEIMKKTHPKQYEWIMKSWDEGGLDYKNVINWLNKHGNLKIKY